MPANTGHMGLSDEGDQCLHSGCDDIGIGCGQQARQVLSQAQMASVISMTSIKGKQQGLGTHIIRMVEVFIGAVLQDGCRHLQHCHHSAGRERWILLGCRMIILKLQVRPGLEQLIKEAVKVVEKCDPVMEVALRAAHVRASEQCRAKQCLFADPAIPFRISRKKFPTRRQGLL